MTRPEAATRIAALGAMLPGFAGCQLVDAARAIAGGSPEMRANVTRAIARSAALLRAEADAYEVAAQFAAEVAP